MKLANHLLLSSLALSASMIGCNKKSDNLRANEKAAVMQSEDDGTEEKRSQRKRSMY
jgi:hypothetical protein